MAIFASKNGTALQADIPRAPELHHWIQRIRHGAPISDRAFDEIFPLEIQNLSPLHWTPIEVIKRAVDFLVGDALGTRVLDVGSGVGKFCVIGSLISSGRFYGVEQRPHFCEIARKIAAHYHLPRLRFLHGSIRDLDWTPFEAIYLFNPFQENKTQRQRLDDSVPLSRELYRAYVSVTTDKLAAMRVGTRVATYHGFGGAFPSSYARESSEWCHRGPLELWTKFR